jgi:hypothetical protein
MRVESCINWRGQVAELKYVPLQPWICDQCDVRGEVEAPFTLTYEDVMERIDAQHAAASPECSANCGHLHVYLMQTAPLPD